MEQRLTPEVFYGAALSALCGLVLGLALHGSWERRPGGPQIWFSSAAAEELARPAKAPERRDEDQASADAAPQLAEQTADLDPGYVPPDPLPVVRLAPDRFPDRFDTKPAAAEDEQRQEVDDLISDAGPQNPAPDDD